jgi:hypothetical protein
MEMSFKRGQTCHDKERNEIAKERYLAPSQNRIDTHLASPKVRQIRLMSKFTTLQAYNDLRQRLDHSLHQSDYLPARIDHLQRKVTPGELLS